MTESKASTPRRFTLREAREALPSVRRITETAAETLSGISQQISALDPGDRRREPLEQEYARRVNDWAGEVALLGCEVKGLFLVDFDNGEGYYCWRWPEADVEHFHGYEEGFSGRMRIN